MPSPCLTETATSTGVCRRAALGWESGTSWQGGRGGRLWPLDLGHKGAAQINLSASWCICLCLPSSYPLQSNNILGKGRGRKRGQCSKKHTYGAVAWGNRLRGPASIASPICSLPFGRLPSRAPTQDDPHLRQESLPPTQAQALGGPAPPSQAAALTESRRLWNSVWVGPPSECAVRGSACGYAGYTPALTLLLFPM